MIHLWMASLLLAVPATVNPTLAFGRLEHRPKHFRIVVGGRCWIIDSDTVSCESHSRNVAGMSAEAQL